MNMLPELEKRRAFRAFLSEDIDLSVMTRVLQAATLAPSCFNSQPWRIIAVKKSVDPAYEAVSATLTPGNAWALNAPYLIIFATAPSLDCRLDEGRDYAFFDLGQAALALQLQAYREGLRAHPMAGFSASKLRIALKLPQEMVPLCVVAVGKPGDPQSLPENLRRSEDTPRMRKPLGEVVFLDSFGTPWIG
jgi:nitroreductase